MGPSSNSHVYVAAWSMSLCSFPSSERETKAETVGRDNHLLKANSESRKCRVTAEILIIKAYKNKWRCFMHRRCLPLWLSSMWPVGERQDGGHSSWLSPSLSLKQWKTVTDKTLTVRSSVLWCSTALGLGSGSVLLLLWTTLLHSVPHGSATFQSHIPELCSPLFGITSWGHISEEWESDEWQQQQRMGSAGLIPATQPWWREGDKNSTLLGMWSLFFPQHHNPQQWFERCSHAHSIALSSGPSVQSGYGSCML